MRDDILKSVGVEDKPSEVFGEHIQVYSIPGGESAVKILNGLQGNVGEVGGSPLLLGDPSNLDHLREALEGAPSPVEWLRQADEWASLDLHEMLRAVKMLELEHLRKHNREHPESAAPDFLLKIREESLARQDVEPPFDPADWPDAVPARNVGLACLFDPVDRKTHKEVLLAIVASSATDVAAFLQFGGWNSCPPPSLHVAIARRWHQKYGALPVAVTHDTIEMYVPRAPQRPEEAWHLAWEHGAYSEENFGTSDTKGLARILWNRPMWQFWWD